MSVLTFVASILRRATRKESETITIQVPPAQPTTTDEKKRGLCSVEARCGYIKMRGLLFDLVGVPCDSDSPMSLLPEGKGIHIEADSKQLMLEIGDGVQLVKVGDVLGVLYRSGKEDLRWRDPHKLWGVVHGETMGKLAARSIYIIRSNRIRV